MHLLFISFIFSLVQLFTPASPLDKEVLEYTNAFRDAKGMPPLEMRDDLNALAQGHSQAMADGRVAFGHAGFETREASAFTHIKQAVAFGENVAYGATTGKEVVDVWKKSSGHRKNMLGKYRFIGIGTATDKKGVIYYTQVFVN